MLDSLWNLPTTKMVAEFYHDEERHYFNPTSSYFEWGRYSEFFVDQADSWYKVTMKKSWDIHSNRLQQSSPPWL